MAHTSDATSSLWRGRTALVTGASSGIGRAFAMVLAEAGCHLILTARRRERLDELRETLTRDHGVRVDAVAADLAVPGGATRLADEVFALGRPVDVLINNAGVGVSGAIADTAWERDQQMAQLNMLSVVELTKRFLPPMRQRGRGHIIFIGSVVGYMPVPYLAHYAATKAFVRSFAHALSQETHGTGVKVTLVTPGTTATEFFETAGYRTEITGENWYVRSPRQVAEAALRAAEAGARTLTPGFANRLMALGGRLLPTGVMLRLAERVQRRYM